MILKKLTKIITSPCPKTRALGAMNRQYIPKGLEALQKGPETLQEAWDALPKGPKA
jgi:hypothetical protein